jgi:hypothetical protein
MIDIAQLLTPSASAAEPSRSESRRRGPRAGRVNGVIQHASAETAGQLLPSETLAAGANADGASLPAADANAAATPTLNGVPVTLASAAASE